MLRAGQIIDTESTGEVEMWSREDKMMENEISWIWQTGLGYGTKTLYLAVCIVT